MADPLGSVFVEILGDADPFSTEFASSIEDAGRVAQEALGESMDAATTGVVEDLTAAGAEGGEALVEGVTGDLDGITDALSEAGVEGGQALTEGVTGDLDGMVDALGTAGAEGGGDLADGVTGALDGLPGEFAAVGDEAAGALEAALGDVDIDVDAGGAFDGIAEEAQGAADDVTDAFDGIGSELADEVTAGVEEAEGALGGLTDSLGSVQGALGTAAGGAGLEMFARGQQDATLSTQRMADRLGESEDTVRSMVDGITNWTFSSADAAAGMEILNQRGVDNLDTMGDLLPVWDDYADATGQELPNAMELGSRALGAFNIPAENAGENVDTLTYLTNELGVPLDRIGRQFRNSGDDLEALGLGLDETTGLLAAMQANGMDSRDALNVLGKAVDGAEGDLDALLDTTGLTREEFEQYTGKVLEAEGMTSRQADQANGLATPMERLGGWVENLGYRFGGVAETAGMVAAPLGALGPAALAANQGMQLLSGAGPMLAKGLGAVSTAFRVLSVAIMSNPLFLIAGLIIGIIAVIWYFRDEIIAGLGAAWNWIRDTAGKVWTWLVDTVGGAVSGVVEWVVNLDARVREWFTRMVTAVIATVTGWVTSVVDWVGSLYERVTGWVGDLRDRVMEFFARMALRALATVLGWVGDVIAAARDLRGKVVGWVSDLVSSVLGWFADLARDTVARVSGLVGDVVGWFRGLPGKVVSALAGIGRTLWNTGKQLVQGLLDGAKSLLGNIGRFFLDMLPKWIRGPFEKALGISSPSTVFAGYGTDMMAGLQDGLDSLTPTVPVPQVDTDALQGSVDSALAVTDGLTAARTVDGLDADFAATVDGAVTRSDEDLAGKVDELIRAVRDGQVVEVDGERLARVTTRVQERRSSRSLRVTPT